MAVENTLDYAVVIGIEHYRANQPLQGPHQDSQRFLDWLLDPDFGALPLCANDPTQSPNVLKLMSTANYTPTQHDVDSWISTVMAGLQSKGLQARRLYFYFSGHGIGITQTNSALLLPEWTTIMRNYALSSEKYLNGLTAKGLFKELYFFMDCCRNRISGVDGLPPIFGAPAPAPNSISAMICYATEFETMAFEKPVLGLDNSLPRGLFTEILVNGLRGAAAGRSGQLKVSDLINYIYRKVPELAQQNNVAQIPQVSNSIPLQNVIVGPFKKKIPIIINFVNAGIDVILEDGDLEERFAGNTDEKQWDLELLRGQYVLRKSGEDSGMNFFVDGLTNTFTYVG